MYKLGILGGMGPEASALFLSRVIANTLAACDEEHIPSVVLNNTLVPDRTAALLGEGESPVEALQADLDRLASLGVEVIATPCNTAHAFLSELVIPEGIRFVNMITETLLTAPAARPLCVLGTTGLNRAGVYESFAAPDVSFVALTDAEQADTMEAITLVKAGEHARATECLLRAANSVKAREERVLFLLSCTELSVLREAFFKEYEALDALEVLAVATVRACDYPIREG